MNCCSQCKTSAEALQGYVHDQHNSRSTSGLRLYARLLVQAVSYTQLDSGSAVCTYNLQPAAADALP
jgi:hypothetical protein